MFSPELSAYPICRHGHTTVSTNKCLLLQGTTYESRANFQAIPSASSDRFVDTPRRPPIDVRTWAPGLPLTLAGRVIRRSNLSVGRASWVSWPGGGFLLAG